MGISYGVAVCLDAKPSRAQLEPIVREVLGNLAADGVVLSISTSRGRTLLAQGDGDHARLWENAELFLVLAGRLAKEFRCRAWSISGHAGTVDRLIIQSFGANGKRAWANRQRAAMRDFMAEARFKTEPFSWNVKPFLELGREWKRVGELRLTEAAEFRQLDRKATATLVGKQFAGAKAWLSVEQWELGDRSVTEVLHVFIENADERALEKWNLHEVGWSQPSFSLLQRDDLVTLPDGSTVRGRMNSVSGLQCERAGKTAVIRWGCTLRSGGAHWLQVLVADGPFLSDYARLQREFDGHRGERLLEKAFQRDDVAAMWKGAKLVEGDGAVLAGDAARKGAWKCFDAALKKLSAKKRVAVRNALLWHLPWAKAVARGADINAPRDEYSDDRVLHAPADARDAKAMLARGASLSVRDARGRTPLHTATDPSVALVLLGAGARLDLEDDEGRLPFETFLFSLGFATPSELDLEVVRQFVKRNAPPSGKRLAAALKTLSRNELAIASVSKLITAAR